METLSFTHMGDFVSIAIFARKETALFFIYNDLQWIIYHLPAVAG
jgi:hypothetical protein